MIKRNRSIEEKLFAYILRLQIKSQKGLKKLTDTGWDRYVENETKDNEWRVTGKTIKNFIKTDKITPEIHTMNIIANIFLKNERYPFKDFKGFSDFLKANNIFDLDKLNEFLKINIPKVQQIGQNPLLKLKNNFNYHFKKWQLSDSYRMTEPEYTNLLEYIFSCKYLTNEMKAFSLVQALYYGNNSCHAQTENNYNNENAIEKN